MLHAVRKLLLFSALASLAFLGARAIYRALASPETKIRWRMEEMVEGFNEMRMKHVLRGIHQEFVDRVADVTREDLHSILAWMFLNELDARGGFLWSAELDPSTISIEVAPGDRSASAACRVQFFRRRGENRELDWDARVAGELERSERGWQWIVITSANHEDRRRR